MSVLFLKQRSSVSEPPFGVVYAIHSQLIGKLVVNILQVITEHFSLALTAEAL